MYSALASADLRDIDAERAHDKRPIAFLYKTPFAGMARASLIFNAGVPRLKDEYLASRRDMFSASAAGLADRQVGAYVIDKSLFPDGRNASRPRQISLCSNPIRSGSKTVTD